MIGHPRIATLLVALFVARLHPDERDPAKAEQLTSEIEQALDEVAARVEVDASEANDLDELYGRIRAALRTAVESHADDRPLMVRLTLVGPTDLHGQLQDVGSALRDDVRSLAAETSEDLWLEKIEVRTAAHLVAANVLEAEDLEELLPEFDDSLLEALRIEFAPFLAGVAQEADGLVAAAADGNWAMVLDVAGAALRVRISGSR